MSNLWNFLTSSPYNLIFLAFCLWITYLIITDNRFLFNRKIIFIFILIVLFILSFYINKAPYEIIKELFWYSLLLNSSFIFHTLICDRLFHYCWKNHYEYLGFIISRISFTLSLWGINYWVSKLRGFLLFFFDDFYTSYEYEQNLHLNNIWIKYAYFYVTYMRTNKLILLIFKVFCKLIINFNTLVQLICINFSLIFHNYSLLILGLKKKEWNTRIIYKFLIQFSILFSISIIIGLPRLYIIWILQIIIECYNIFNLKYHPRKGAIDDYKKLNIIEKIKFFFKDIKKNSYVSGWYYNTKYKELEEIYEKPYHKFFMSDLCAYNSMANWSKHTLYKFCSWEFIALRYIKYRDLYYKENADNYEDTPYPIRPQDERIEDIIFWLDLINKTNDEKLYLKLLNLDISNVSLDDFYENLDTIYE